MNAVAASFLLLVQAAQPNAVRVWRADSTAYVALRQPGHLLVLHVDAIGRIQVLHPLTPEDPFAVSAESPIAIPLPPTAEGNPATFLAIRSRWPFDFSAVRWGAWWDYQNALLLQPTAGDPLAALLEIADRVTDGRPYEFAEATYSRRGALVARGPVQPPDVCLGCVRRAPPLAAVEAPAPTGSVDCANATLTNSFCGVASAPVSITSVTVAAPPQVVTQPAPAPAYVPYYLPVFVHGGRPHGDRLAPPPPPPPPVSRAAAYPIAPRLVVPSRAEIRGRQRH
jgi:hypothetical protein